MREMTTARPSPADRVPAALILLPAFFFAVVGLLILGPVLAPFGLFGFAVGELIAFGALPLAVVWYARRQLGVAAVAARTASQLPLWRLFGGGVLLGCAVALINVLIIAPISSQWMSAEDLLRLEDSLLPANLPLIVILPLLTVVPSICEEYVFRGLLVGALVPRLGKVAAVVIAAVAFGLFHGSLGRALPTAWLGLVCGLALVRTGHLLAPIAIHFANNLVALVLASGVASGLAEGLFRHPAATLGVIVVLGTGGFVAFGPGRARAAAPAPVRRLPG